MRYPLSRKVATFLGLTPGYGESPKKGITSLKRPKNETSTRVKHERRVFTNDENFPQNDTVRPSEIKGQTWVYLHNRELLWCSILNPSEMSI